MRGGKFYPLPGIGLIGYQTNRGENLGGSRDISMEVRGPEILIPLVVKLIIFKTITPWILRLPLKIYMNFDCFHESTMVKTYDFNIKSFRVTCFRNYSMFQFFYKTITFL